MKSPVKKLHLYNNGHSTDLSCGQTQASDFTYSLKISQSHVKSWQKWGKFIPRIVSIFSPFGLWIPLTLLVLCGFISGRMWHQHGCIPQTAQEICSFHVISYFLSASYSGHQSEHTQWLYWRLCFFHVRMFAGGDAGGELQPPWYLHRLDEVSQTCYMLQEVSSFCFQNVQSHKRLINSTWVVVVG